MGKSGKWEYVQVLRLLETFDLDDIHGAVRDALRLGAIGYDAVKHLVLCRIEHRPPKLDLDIYPFLPRARVATTSAASYMGLLQEAGTPRHSKSTAIGKGPREPLDASQPAKDELRGVIGAAP